MLKPDATVFAADLLIDQAIDVLMKFGSEADRTFLEQAMCQNHGRS